MLHTCPPEVVERVLYFLNLNTLLNISLVCSAGRHAQQCAEGVLDMQVHTRSHTVESGDPVPYGARDGRYGGRPKTDVRAGKHRVLASGSQEQLQSEDRRTTRTRRCLGDFAVVRGVAGALLYRK